MCTGWCCNAGSGCRTGWLQGVGDGSGQQSASISCLLGTSCRRLWLHTRALPLAGLLLHGQRTQSCSSMRGMLHSKSSWLGWDGRGQGCRGSACGHCSLPLLLSAGPRCRRSSSCCDMHCIACLLSCSLEVWAWQGPCSCTVFLHQRCHLCWCQALQVGRTLGTAHHVCVHVLALPAAWMEHRSTEGSEERVQVPVGCMQCILHALRQARQHNRTEMLLPADVKPHELGSPPPTCGTCPCTMQQSAAPGGPQPSQVQQELQGCLVLDAPVEQDKQPTATSTITLVLAASA
jgi:hypothetical protein